MRTNESIKSKCPKCNGNLFLDKDHYGWYEQCLQCGFTRNVEKTTDRAEKMVRVSPIAEKELTGVRK